MKERGGHESATETERFFLSVCRLIQDGGVDPGHGRRCRRGRSRRGKGGEGGKWKWMEEKQGIGYDQPRRRVPRSRSRSLLATHADDQAQKSIPNVQENYAHYDECEVE